MNSIYRTNAGSLTALGDDEHSHEDGLHILPPFDPKIPRNPQPDTIGPVNTPDLSQTFLLSSLPGANQTIYLDFNGHTTSGTLWNSNFNGGAAFTTPAYDFDGNSAAFSNAELERIQYVWQRVVEDFSPFNVNVTTQAPAVSDLIKSGAGDTRWGVRVVIGGSSYDWFRQGAGGVAYLNSFNWDTDTPTYVFDEELANGEEKFTADAIVHEVGHTFGLDHDGRTTPPEEYYIGHGSGETGWAPAMGAGFYQNLVQWSKGEYTAANNAEDDLQIITSRNGFGYRADDRGNTIGTASLLTVSGTALSGSGIIERTTDVDFYQFSTGAGSINLTINPFNRGPNLDISAKLYNLSGTVVASSNPADLLSANISATVGTGTYYLAVEGIGKGDPLGTGYTDYGSLGQYVISGTAVNNSGTEVGLSVSPSRVFEDRSQSLVYTFTRVGNTANSLTVNYRVGGTAALNSDYTQSGATSFAATAGTITFDAGSSTKTITVDPTADTVDESNESVVLQLKPGSGYTAGTTASISGIILNDDSTTPSVTLAVAPARLYENSTRNFIYTFTRVGDIASPLTVNYGVGGTAAFNSDYSQSGAASFAATAGTVTFDAGSSTKTITIDPTADTTVESDETVALQLTAGAGYRVGTGAARTATILNDDRFGRPAQITINDGGSATPYPSTINATGLSGTITSLKVTLRNINHTWPDDIDILLVGPTGAKTLLMSDVGGFSALSNTTLTFSSVASQSLPDSGSITSGTYLPTDVGTGDTFAAPAPAGPYGASFTPFNGTNPNGVWRLYVVDDALADVGTIANGWTLEVGTASSSLTFENTDGSTGTSVGSGRDVLTGGAGNDTLTGGGGADLFLYASQSAFSSSAFGQDTITDFQVGSDKIALGKATFPALTSAAGGGLNSTDFAVVTSDSSAAGSNALIVYSSESGTLHYNQNGSESGFGSGAAFATISDKPGLTATDFLVLPVKG